MDLGYRIVKLKEGNEFYADYALFRCDISSNGSIKIPKYPDLLSNNLEIMKDEIEAMQEAFNHPIIDISDTTAKPSYDGIDL